MSGPGLIGSGDAWLTWPAVLGQPYNSWALRVFDDARDSSRPDSSRPPSAHSDAAPTIPTAAHLLSAAAEARPEPCASAVRGEKPAAAPQRNGAPGGSRPAAPDPTAELSGGPDQEFNRACYRGCCEVPAQQCSPVVGCPRLLGSGAEAGRRLRSAAAPRLTGTRFP